MSRVGKKPLIIPQGVDVTIDGQQVAVKGPKGQLSATINEMVRVAMVEEEGQQQVTVSVADEEHVAQRAQWGTARSVIANLIDGVTEGFTKELEVNGVGYRVAVSGRKVVLNVGYSHPVEFALPEGVDAAVEGNKITLTGIDKQQVGEVAAQIRKVRKPEPYKGKGIKYVDEVIRRKAGKAAKAGE